MLTVPEENGLDQLPDHPVMARWWAHMADIMETHPDNRPVQTALTPVFHCHDGGKRKQENAHARTRRRARYRQDQCQGRRARCGERRGAGCAAHPQSDAQDGPYPHYDTEALWDFVCTSLADLAQAPGFDAISITAHGAAAALLAEDGSLALPVLDYEHSYDDAIQAQYRSLRPPFLETFSPAQAMGLNLGAQLHYQKTRFPDAFARVATLLTYPQYWAYRLTGVMANE